MPGMQDLADHNALVAGRESGPWFVGYQNDYPYVIDRAPKSSNDYPDHDADVVMVAKPFDVRGMTAVEVAQLIAAAPDLLEALIAARDRKHTPDLWEMVNAAIAKATGSQQ